MGPSAAILPDGQRLHLQHGPIDLVIGADGARGPAFAAAKDRFHGLLQTLVDELPDLRAPLTSDSRLPAGPVARRMHAAAMPVYDLGYLTRMAAVAGAVADEILAAMVDAAPLRRAYVNNGGDIALHLAEGERYASAVAGHRGQMLGQISVSWDDPVRGIATSGRHGRSLSMGIADSVTVLARNAAGADVAATLVANAVDLPGHPAITRGPADTVAPDSDLGNLPVVTDCAALTPGDRDAALRSGLGRAEQLVRRGSIAAAALFLQGQAVMTEGPCIALKQKEFDHA
ncbi:UPF0280 family protein [Chachezhania antarctica]|uniref:UPF0280 family protein n=1 Tax=Chachezhania antarctica TaxID=2340860 RepID=UPI000EAF3EE3|nr:UPF0280 family protein [Chachezhania antarctica]